MVTLSGAGHNQSFEFLVKTAKVTSDGHLVEQRDYVYLDEEHQFDRIYLSPANVRRMLRQIPLLEQSVRNDIQRGLRWYSKAVSSDDATDKYLASWIGFEAIGPYLCGSFGLSRGGLKRYEAVIKHLLASANSESLDVFTIEQLINIRGEIAHGGHVRPASVTESQLMTAALELQSALTTGILSMLARGTGAEGATGQTWSAALPPDHEIRPEMMLGVRYSEPITTVRPWFGEWAELEWSWVGERSSNEEGEYRWGAGVEHSYTVTAAHPGVSSTGMAMRYLRRGSSFTDFSDETTPSMPNGPWREHSLPRAWRTIIDQQETEDCSE